MRFYLPKFNKAAHTLTTRLSVFVSKVLFFFYNLENKAMLQIRTEKANKNRLKKSKTFELYLMHKNEMRNHIKKYKTW